MIKKYPSSVASQIEKEISSSLDNIGIMYRIFNRVKSKRSIEKKLNEKSKYRNGEAKIQDSIGIRVVLYFPDDIKIVHKIISDLFEENTKDASIDSPDTNTFSPVRYNLVYKVKNDQIYTFSSEHDQYIDSTFELQIRTVFSEGWHEVEHDLRYKFKSDWSDSTTESRTLNGVYASLETSEWTMIQILDGVAYKNYKAKNWESMLRHKFRLRLSNYDLNKKISNIFNKDLNLAKKFFRISREELIHEIYKKFRYPLTINNIIYLANTVIVKNNDITELTPPEFIEDILSAEPV